MKRRYLDFIILLSIICIFVGCGKDSHSELSEAYQEEFGMTEDEADEWASLSEELQKDEEEYLEKEQQKAEEKIEAEKKFSLCEPKEEIKKSQISDEIVQVSDAILSTDGSMTLGDVQRELSKNSAVIINSGDTEITDASLVESGKQGSYKAVDEEGNVLCYCEYINDDPSVKAALDCKVIGINPPGEDSMSILNYFYPGDICAATYMASDRIKESDEYKTRLSEYPQMTYQNAEETMKSKGAEINLDEKFYVVTYSPHLYNLENEDYCRQRLYTFNVNMLNSTVETMSVSDKYNKASFLEYSYNAAMLAYLDEDDTIRQEIYEWCLSRVKSVDGCDNSIDILGYGQLSKLFAPDILFKTDKDMYAVMDIPVVYHYFDGSTKFNVEGYDPVNLPREALYKIEYYESMEEMKNEFDEEYLYMVE